jgi:hypothetical protein
MPLLDHFNPPLNRTHPWRSFHGAWAAAMARLLNQGVLPPGYYAVPLVDRDGPIEIDVAALRDQGVSASEALGPRPWAPPEPSLTLRVDLPSADAVEVQIFCDDGDPRLAAAVELISPRNKDRPQARHAFAVKCVGYLQQGSSVVVVDTVTTRRSDMNREILQLAGGSADAEALPPGLSAVSYRSVSGDDEKQELLLWSAPLALGQPLPTLPLWIASDFSVPLDLNSSYETACTDLRIRQVG